MPNRRSSKLLKPVTNHESLKTKILRRVNEENANSATNCVEESHGHGHRTCRKTSTKLACGSTSDSSLDKSLSKNRLSSLRRSKSSTSGRKDFIMDSERMHRKCKESTKSKTLREFYSQPAPEDQTCGERGESRNKRNRSTMRPYTAKMPVHLMQGSEKVEPVHDQLTKVSSDDTKTDSQGSVKPITRRLRSSATSLAQKYEIPLEVIIEESAGGESKVEGLPNISPVAPLLQRQVDVPDSPCKLVIIENATMSMTFTEPTCTLAETSSSNETSQNRSTNSNASRQMRKRKLKLADDGDMGIPLKEKKQDKETQTTRSTLSGVADDVAEDQATVSSEIKTLVGRDGPVSSSKMKFPQTNAPNLDTKMTQTVLPPIELKQTTAAQCTTLINQGTSSVFQPSSTVVPLHSTGLMVTKSAATEAAKAFAGRKAGPQVSDTHLDSNQTAVNSSANVHEVQNKSMVVSGSAVQSSPSVKFISTTAIGQCKPSVRAAERRLPTPPALTHDVISVVSGEKNVGTESLKASEGNATGISPTQIVTSIPVGGDKCTIKEHQSWRQSQPIVHVVASDGSSSLTPMTVTHTGLPELAQDKERLSVSRSRANAPEALGLCPTKSYVTLENVSNTTKDRAPICVGSSKVLPSTSTSTSKLKDEDESLSESGEKIKRPMNAFMIWSREQRATLARENPKMTNADISVRLGNMWNDLDYDLKQGFFDEANRLKQQHKQDHPGWVYQPRPNKRRRRRQSPATGHAAHQTCNQLLLVLPDGKQIICPAIPVPSNGQQGGVAENVMNQISAMNVPSSVAIGPALHNTRPDVKVFQQDQPKLQIGNSLAMNNQNPQNQGGCVYLTPISQMPVNAANHPQPLGSQIQVMPAGTHLLQQGASIMPGQQTLQISGHQTLPSSSGQAQVIRLTNTEKVMPPANTTILECPKMFPNVNQPTQISSADIRRPLQQPVQMSAQNVNALTKGAVMLGGNNQSAAIASSQGAQLVTLSNMNQIVTLPFTIDKSFVQGPSTSAGPNQLITLLKSQEPIAAPANSCPVPILPSPFSAAQPHTLIQGPAMERASAQSGLKANVQNASQGGQVAPSTPGTPGSAPFRVVPQKTVIDLTASPASGSSLAKLHVPGGSSPCIGMNVTHAAGSPAALPQMSAPERLLASLAMSGVDLCGVEESEKLFDRVMHI